MGTNTLKEANFGIFNEGNTSTLCLYNFFGDDP